MLCLTLLLFVTYPSGALELIDKVQQGALVRGKVAAKETVYLGDKALEVSPEGHFIFGIGRDDEGQIELRVNSGNEEQTHRYPVIKRSYRIERVDGLPPSRVTAPPEQLARIREEAQQVRSARAKTNRATNWLAGFQWPAKGRLSGFYGSQRILNGEPKRPHYGIDIAAPAGSPVIAPAAGIIRLANKDLYYSGGTIILDHGFGLSSSFLHLQDVLVEDGQEVQQGEMIGKIGMTGRATGPHLDWRMNWQDKRLDPGLLFSDKPEALDKP